MYRKRKQSNNVVKINILNNFFRSALVFKLCRNLLILLLLYYLMIHFINFCSVNSLLMMVDISVTCLTNCRLE